MSADRPARSGEMPAVDAAAKPVSEPPDVDSLMSRLDGQAVAEAEPSEPALEARKPTAAELLGGRGRRAKRTIRVPDDAVPAGTPPPAQVRRSTPPPAPAAALRPASVPPPPQPKADVALAKTDEVPAATPMPFFGSETLETAPVAEPPKEPLAPVIEAKKLSSPPPAPPRPASIPAPPASPVISERKSVPPPVAAPPSFRPPAASEQPPPGADAAVRIMPTRMIQIGEPNRSVPPPPPTPIAPAAPAAAAPSSPSPPLTPQPPPPLDPDATAPQVPHHTVQNLDATVREALAMLDRDDFEAPPDIDINVTTEGDDEPTMPNAPKVALPGDGDRISNPNEESIDEVEEVVSPPTTKSKHTPPPRKGGGSRSQPIPGQASPSDPAFTALRQTPTAPAVPTAVSLQTLPSANVSKVPSDPAPAAHTSQPKLVAAANATAGAPVQSQPEARIAPAPSTGPASNPVAETTGEIKRKKRQWFEELFNDDYTRTMAKAHADFLEREVKFIEDGLSCDKGATVLDLGCGTGEHAVALAKRGFEVIGIDLSLAMLARAADEAAEKQQRINFVQGDMRDLNFEEAFDGIYCWGTTFGYFDDQKNIEVVQKIHRALRRGGRFLLDVANRDYIVGRAPSMVWFEAEGCVCMDEMQMNSINSRVQVKRTMMMEDGRQREIDYSIRLYALHELGKLLHDNGFRVVEASGDTSTPAVYFGAESPRIIILAEKR